MTMLNENGDVTISWDNHQDSHLHDLIKRKLDQGYAFFIMKTQFIEIMKEKKQLKSISELGEKLCEITFHNVDVKELLRSNNEIMVGKAPSEEIQVCGNTRDINRIVTLDTLAIRPINGR